MVPRVRSEVEEGGKEDAEESGASVVVAETMVWAPRRARLEAAVRPDWAELKEETRVTEKFFAIGEG